MDFTKNTDFHIENYLNYKIYNPKLAKDVMYLVCTTQLLSASYNKFPDIIPVIYIDFLQELPYLMEEVLKNIKNKQLTKTKIIDYKFLIEGILKVGKHKYTTEKENRAIKELEDQFNEFILICQKELNKLEDNIAIIKKDATKNQFKINAKWLALLYFFELKASNNQPPTNIDGEFKKNEIERVGLNYLEKFELKKTGQAFYRQFNKINGLKPSEFKIEFGSGWKEKIYILSNYDKNIEEYFESSKYH